ncbi:MAG: hypothetical protein AAFW84_15940 [Cyanobacteria bacterium J06635_15]
MSDNGRIASSNIDSDAFEEMMTSDDEFLSDHLDDYSDSQDDLDRLDAEYHRHDFDFESEDEGIDLDPVEPEVKENFSRALFIEKQLADILKADNSSNYFAKLITLIDSLRLRLQGASGTRERPLKRERANRNDRHLSSQRRFSRYLLESQLKQLRLLAHCYQKRGLSEANLLEDVIPVFKEADSRYLSVITAGLATRVLIIPMLNSSDCVSTTASGLKLITAIHKVILLLAEEDILETLPGLIRIVSERADRESRECEVLPKMLYQTARRAADSSRFRQQLMASASRHEKPLSMDANAMPTKVKINVPIEIFFQPFEAQ